jgi:hypothetical protein
VDTVGSAIFGESNSVGNVFVGVRIVLCLFNLNSKKSWEALVARYGHEWYLHYKLKFLFTL